MFFNHTPKFHSLLIKISTAFGLSLMQNNSFLKKNQYLRMRRTIKIRKHGADFGYKGLKVTVT